MNAMTTRKKLFLAAIVLTLAVCLAIPVTAKNSRDAKLARLEELTAIKDAFPGDEQAAQFARLDKLAELADVKAEVVPARDLYAGSDWIERHPSVIVKVDPYAGSDYIERHPPFDPYAGSDWIERHPGDGKP